MSKSIRLEREAPAAAQGGATVIIGIFLTILGGAFLLGMRNEALRPGTNGWVIDVVGGGFSLVGVVLLILGIKMILMSRLPETIVEVEKMPVRAGELLQFTVRQPGPIRLESLRVNLVAEQITKREVWRNGRRQIETDRRLIHQHNVVDLEGVTIEPGNEIARKAGVMMPARIDLADIEGRATVVWKLEVWGRVRGWVDFGHAFVVDVLSEGSRNTGQPHPVVGNAKRDS